MLFTPKTRVITISGVKVPIDPDFRIMCEFGVAAIKNDMSALREIAERFYPLGLSEGVDGTGAAEGMSRFYSEGLAPGSINKKKSDNISSKTPEPSFDYEEDEAYFYAAFLSEYGIDLTTAKLHWLDFCALFRGLPDECRLKRIIAIRAENLSDIKSNAEKNRVRKLKQIFALKSSRKIRYSSAAERDRALIAAAERRFREAKMQMNGGDTS